MLVQSFDISKILSLLILSVVAISRFGIMVADDLIFLAA
jgi:hypothetical protein